MHGGLGLLALTACDTGETTDRLDGVRRSTETYGPHPRQFGQLWLPRSSERDGGLPVVVLVHGGFWRPGFGPDLEDRVAASLATRGFAVWNIDYRASDVAWPATMHDAAAAMDFLRRSRAVDRFDLERVAVVGHSAGGHLALWLASRSRLPEGAPGAPGPESVAVRLAIAQAPVADLVLAAQENVGGRAVQLLLDGPPDEVPERYAVTSPVALLPSDEGATVLLVHGADDEVVPVSQSRAYLEAAEDTSRPVRLRVVPDVGHFEHLDPTSTAFRPVRRALAAL